MLINVPTNRQRVRLIHRQTSRQTDKQTDRQTDRQNDRQTDRQTDIKTDQPIKRRKDFQSAINFLKLTDLQKYNQYRIPLEAQKARA